MSETTWTPVQLRALPRWWERAALKPQHVLAQWGRSDVQVLLDAYEAERARAERLAAQNERLLPMVRSYLVGMSYQKWYCRSCGVEAPISDDIESLCHVAPCPLAGDAPGREGG